MSNRKEKRAAPRAGPADPQAGPATRGRGNPQVSEAAARHRAEIVAAVAELMQMPGLATTRATLALSLNRSGFRTYFGRRWTASNVKHLIASARRRRELFPPPPR